MRNRRDLRPNKSDGTDRSGCSQWVLVQVFVVRGRCRS